MSFLTGESLKSSISDSDSPRLSPSLSKHNDSICNSDSTQPSYSPAKSCQQTADQNRIKTKREVYKYETGWLVSSVAWSNYEGESFELAIGSFIEDYNNQVHIVSLCKDSYDEEIELHTSFDHPYPPTKISWIPKIPDSTATGQLPRLIATSADYLRIWRIPPTKNDTNFVEKQSDKFINNTFVTECDSTSDPGDELVKLECSLSPTDMSKYRAPLSSFDWNEIDNRIIVTSSTDTTCAVWDIEMGTQISTTNQITSPTSSQKISCQLKNQILAHDHEVYDVSFSRQGSGRDVFVTAGGDGSMRLFDLRMLSISKVLYETSTNGDSLDKSRPIGPALVRLACNKQDANYVSAFSIDSKDVILIDVRKAGKPVAVLRGHNDCLKSISWAPHSAYHLSSASDDNQALIWGLSNLQEPSHEPLLAYRANGRINTINWSASHPDWIAIGFENSLELLRV